LAFHIDSSYSGRFDLDYVSSAAVVDLA